MSVVCVCVCLSVSVCLICIECVCVCLKCDFGRTYYPGLCQKVQPIPRAPSLSCWTLWPGGSEVGGLRGNTMARRLGIFGYSSVHM